MGDTFPNYDKDSRYWCNYAIPTLIIKAAAFLLLCVVPCWAFLVEKRCAAHVLCTFDPLKLPPRNPQDPSRS